MFVSIELTFAPPFRLIMPCNNIDRTNKCGNVPYIEAIRKWLSIRNVCVYAIWFFIAKTAFNYALMLMGASNLNIRQTYYDIIA